MSCSIKELRRQLKEYIKRKEEKLKPKKYPPSLAEGKIHFVTLNSGHILKDLGWNSNTERIFAFEGHYNQEEQHMETGIPVYLAQKSKHKETVLNQIVFEHRFRWKGEVEDVWDEAYTLEQILEIVHDEGAADITFTKLGVLLKYPTKTIYAGIDVVPFENISARIFKRWSFNPSSFEKRGAPPPELRIYQTFRETLAEMYASIPPEIIKRRRATVLVNEASDILNLEDAKRAAKNRRWIKVLQRVGRSFRIITLEEIEEGKGWEVF
jgi:hypothetical protein